MCACDALQQNLWFFFEKHADSPSKRQTNMTGSKRKKAAATTATGLKKGDIVWVRPGIGPHEEPAIVLETGCEYEDNPDKDDNSSSSSSTEDDDKRTDATIKTDGIRCRFTVSNYDAVFAGTMVRPFDDSSTKRSRRQTDRLLPTSVLSSTSAPRTKPNIAKQPPTPKLAADNPSSASEGEDSEDETDGSEQKANASPYFSEGTHDEEPKEESYDSSDGEALATLKAKAATTKPKPKPKPKQKPTPKTNTAKKGSSKATPKATKKASEEPTKRAAKGEQKKKQKETKATVVKKTTNKGSPAPAPLIQHNNSSSDEDEEDRPYKIEYSVSGRAKCRRCDETIEKGSLRVSHVPLFNGKVSTRTRKQPSRRTSTQTDMHHIPTYHSSFNHSFTRSYDLQQMNSRGIRYIGISNAQYSQRK